VKLGKLKAYPNPVLVKKLNMTLWLPNEKVILCFVDEQDGTHRHCYRSQRCRYLIQTTTRQKVLRRLKNGKARFACVFS